jgi:uncharacterized membrane protein YphA (DoxX/SURF4 family)
MMDDELDLEHLLWARRNWFGAVGLVFLMLVTVVVLEAGHLSWFLFFIAVGVLLLALYEIVRLSVRIRRERRG